MHANHLCPECNELLDRREGLLGVSYQCLNPECLQTYAPDEVIESPAVPAEKPGYELLQFNLGTGFAQAYVMRGMGKYEGTNVQFTQNDVAGIEGKDQLAAWLDRQFLREHAERSQRHAQG